MARIRTIKPKFWDDIKIGRISRDARLLYIGLWTFADDLGTVIADPLWLKSKIFPYDQIQIQQMKAWLTMLEKNGFICHVTVRSETFIYLPNFSRHQMINRPNLDDVNVSKELLLQSLREITDQSVINHGTITDQSLTIIGEDKDSNIPSIIPPKGGNDGADKITSLIPPTRKEKVAQKRKEPDLSFVEPSFQPIMADWLSYKSERGQTYRQKGVESCYKRLLELSGHDAVRAQQIVEQSKANNWAGLFQLKTQDNGRPERNYGEGNSCVEDADNYDSTI